SPAAPAADALLRRQLDVARLRGDGLAVEAHDELADGRAYAVGRAEIGGLVRTEPLGGPAPRRVGVTAVLARERGQLGRDRAVGARVRIVEQHRVGGPCTRVR